MPPSEGEPDGPVIDVAEIRAYPRINAEVVRRLDLGLDRVVLAGAEGQRLLLAGLRGDWGAVVEVEGHAGPELAAGLDAPNLLVIGRGPAGDGAGRALQSGRLLIRGDAGHAVGYAQRGGRIVVVGRSGPRAGLDRDGGTLILLGPVGRLAGERQAGGLLVAFDESLGPYAGLGRRGGSMVRLGPGGTWPESVGEVERLEYRSTLDDLATWLASERP